MALKGFIFLPLGNRIGRTTIAIVLMAADCAAATTSSGDKFAPAVGVGCQIPSP